MAYTSDKKPGALTQATVLANTDNVVVEQSGDVKRATLAQVEAKIFDAKTATSTPTGTEVAVVRLTDGNLRQVALSDIVPAGNITNAKVSDSAAIADTKLATIATTGKVLNSATTATPDSDANTIVARDGSGNFSAGTITATLAGSITGNAATATAATTANTATILATGRTIALTGDVTGTTESFNGSANVSATATIANSAVTTAKIADANVTTAKLADASVTTAKIADGGVTDTKLANGIDASKLTTGTLPADRIGLDAITTAKIADANVTTAKLADASVTTAKIANGGVTTAKIADASVTNSKLGPDIVLVPPGAVMPFAMNSAPTGWLAANGGEVSRSTFAALFGAIGTTHGAGNGSTTFNLPDLRGIFVRGSGSQTISGTTYSKSFATKERDAFQAHKHTLRTRNAFGGDADFVSREAGGNTIVTANAMVGYAADGSNGTPRTAVETRPANIALLYCIKF